MTDHPALTRLRPDLRCVLAPNPSAMTGPGTNTWIVGQGAVAVIDPGPADAGHLEAILASLDAAERISHILVTHPHSDHSALAPALSRHAAAPVLAFGTAQDGTSPVMAALADSGAGGEGLDMAFVPDMRLADGDRVADRGWTLTAVHTPGHLGSHLSFRWGDLCFSGDHVMGWSTSVIAPPQGDMGAYMASLALLAGQRWTAFLPGHGAPVTDPAARLAQITAHRREREAQILAALAAGPASAAQIAAMVYTALPTGLRRAAESNVLAHLIDLESRKLIGTDHPLSPASRFHLRQPKAD